QYSKSSKLIHYTTLFRSVLDDSALRGVAQSDLYWDEIVAITPAGTRDVYDLTVPGPASWLADGVVMHNSGAIEQDADLVMFIYRSEEHTSELQSREHLIC